MNSSAHYGAPRRARFGGSVVMVTGVIAAVVATTAALWAIGVIDPSRLRSERSTAGLVAVPIAARPIAAYKKVSQADLLDSQKGDFAVVYLRPQAIEPGVMTRLADILGRVLNREKSAGFLFKESDFFPVGTREGLVAGIPAGKRAIRVDASQVDGLFGLHPGDRFDLVATLPIETGRGASNQGLTSVGGVYGQQLSIQARLSNWQKQATVRVIAQSAALVEAMTTRQVPVFSNTLTQGGVTRMRPIQEVVVAVNPDEVVRLTEALAVEAKISAVPRSGRPDDPMDSITPDLRPTSPFLAPGASGLTSAAFTEGADRPQVGAFTMVETISGTKREMTAVPRR